MVKADHGDRSGHSKRDHIKEHLGARKIEFISTAIICVVFAASFAHLEYYYIKDPALQVSYGEVIVTDSNFDRSRETEPILGNMYQYHLFPMLFIFVLISFVALWDDILFKLLGRHNRIKAAVLGIANLITAILVEDFAWFANRLALPLESDPKGGLLMQASDWTSKHMGYIDFGSFVLPGWYLVALGLATIGYYGAFRKHDRLS